ncbi:hypothetical protein D9611_011143 [Ephemerocybe angulata]|uniref:F-box domain-containing protein n=1 Tax=Ephemerocybe angulata TaxID=980116 RepID=A0A8H5FJH3_9AGAR|nr:hypothetical protein D9611_011143 [Tulosesus angulatus]
MDLPEEIIAKILSYLREPQPTALTGLQVAYACKSLYQDFRPIILQVMAHLRSTAERRRSLALFVGAPEYSEDPDEPAPAPLKEIVFTSHSCEDADTIWSVHSLLLNPEILAGLRRFQLSLKLDNQWIWAGSPPKAHVAWIRAVVRLLGRLLENDAVKLEIVMTPHPYTDSITELLRGMHSLFSRLPSTTAPQQPRIHLSFNTDAPWPHLNASRSMRFPIEWRKALHSLLETCVRHNAIDLRVACLNQPPSQLPIPLFLHDYVEPVRAPPRTISLASLTTSVQGILSRRALATMNPSSMVTSTEFFGPFNKFRSTLSLQALAFQMPETPLSNGGFSSLLIRDQILSPLFYPHFDMFIRHSHHSLTHLQIYRCELGQNDWRAILPQWTLPQLANFSVEETEIPLPAIYSFVQNNTSITDLKIMTYLGGMPSDWRDIKSRKLAVRTLAGTPTFLVALFGRASVFTFPHLQNLSFNQEREHPRIPFRCLSLIPQVLLALSRRGAVPRSLSLRLSCDLNEFREALFDPIQIRGPDNTNVATTLVKSLERLHQLKYLHLSIHDQFTCSGTSSICHAPNFIGAPTFYAATLLAAAPALETAVLQGVFVPTVESNEGKEFWEACKKLKSLEIKSYGGISVVVWNRPHGHSLGV